MFSLAIGHLLKSIQKKVNCLTLRTVGILQLLYVGLWPCPPTPIVLYSLSVNWEFHILLATFSVARGSLYYNNVL